VKIQLFEQHRKGLNTASVHILWRNTSLALADIGLSPLFNPDRFDLDETGGIGWLEATELVHGGFLLIVQTLIGRPALDDDVALVQLQPDNTVHGPLGGGDGAGDELAFRGKEVTIVQDLRELDGEELIPQSTDVPIECQTLKVDVSSTENGSSGSLVASTGLDTDEPVFDDIDTSNAVLSSESVKDVEHLDTVGVGFAVRLGAQFSGQTTLELDGDALWLGRGVLGSGGELPHVDGRGGVRVLENTCLVGDVIQVLVGGPWLGGGLGDGDAGLRSIGEQSLATWEAVVEDRDTPRSNDLDVRLEPIEGKFEADLIIAFASATVRDEVASLALSDSDHATGDDGAGERSTKEVHIFIDAVRLDSGVDQFSDELAPEILQEEFFGADFEGLLLCGGEVLLLSNISHECVDFIALFNQPFQDARGVKTSGVGEQDATFRLGHFERKMGVGCESVRGKGGEGYR
jgi:hypothetical protein